MEQLRFRLEDFFPIYTMEDEKEFYNSVPIKKEFDDARAVLNEPRPQRGEQLKHQAFMMRFLSPHTPYDKMVAFHGLGSGKCLGKDTPVLMYDGTIKKIQDVAVGDLVMGDDSTPRNVLSTTKGIDNMYDIIPVKGEKYTVNSKHILTLKITNSGVANQGKRQPNRPYQAVWIDKNTIKQKQLGFATKEEAEKFLNDNIKEDDKILDIEIEKYLNLSSTLKSKLKGIRTGVTFKEKELNIDPYLIGYWLGDGTSRDPNITTIEQEVIEYFNKELKKYNLYLVKHQNKYTYGITNIYEEGENKHKKNFFKDILRKYNLIENKHIPYDFKVNSRENRLKLLAGLIDSDGYLDNGSCYEIIQKNKSLAKDILYLCRSLGFAAYMKECKKSCMYKGEKKEGTYYRVNFSGKGVEEIPCVVSRKKSDERKQIKDALVTGIKVVPKGLDEYYGFMLDGNGRFLLGDFTITHNSCLLTSVSEYAKTVKSGELSNNKIIILTRNPTLRKNLINEITCICTPGKYEPPLRDPKTRELLSKDTQRRRVEKAIGVEYEILTFTMFVKEIYNKSNDQLRAEYSNRYILIDEAHNIKLQPNKKSKDEEDILGLQLRSRGVSNYKEIHRFLHCVIGCKILLLTATPMRDQPSEICNLLNLILPLEKQLNKKEFKNIFFDGNTFKDELKNEFKSYIRNRISYVRASTTDITIVNEGVVDEDFKYTKTVLLDMDDYQDEKYKEAYKKDVGSNGELNADVEVEDDGEEDGSSGLWLNSRQASMFVPFDNKVKLNDLIVKDRNNYRPSEHLIKYLKKNGDSLDAMLKQLKKCSVKYWLVVRDLYKYPTQKFFIYSNIVKGSGALLLGAILEVFGFDHAPNIKEVEGSTYCQTQGKESKDLPISENPNRMLVLTGSTLSASQLDNMVNNIFNNKKNVYGDYIRVIIGSHIIGEGVSFKHIRRIYVLTPGWNSATTEQAIGRGIRYKSHEELKQDERKVSILRVCVQPVMEIGEEYGSIDSQMYKISEDKDIRIKQVERLMKEASVDCALNRSRNVLPTDKPNTKECDYMDSCEYKCDLVDEKFYYSNWVGERIVDTYNLYYAEREINIVKSAVRKAFGYKFAFDFEELYNYIKDDIRNIPSLVLARALDNMIVNNDTIYNKFGIVNYLREDRNMFFLVDDPLEMPVFTSYYYSKDPSPEKSIGSYETILQYFQYDKIEDIINILIKNQKNEKILNNVFNNLSAEICQKFVEMFYIAKLKKSDKNKDLQNFILQKFSMFLKDVNGNIISNVILGNIRVLERGKLVWSDINEEQIENLKSMKTDKVNELRNNPYRIYAVITDKYTGKEVHKNLKLVEINEKKSYGGTSCSTTPYDLNTIVGIYYAIVKRSRELGSSLPVLGNKEYTLDEIKKLKHYKAMKSYIFENKYISELRDYIIDTDALKEFIFRLSNDKEKKKLKKYIEKEVLDEDDIMSILKTVSDKKELVFLYTKMTNEEFMDDIEDKVEDEINSLSEDVINILGNMLDKKTAPDICGSLKEWFIENNLYINEADLIEI